MQLLRNIPAVLPQPCVATIGFLTECIEDIAT